MFYSTLNNKKHTLTTRIISSFFVVLFLIITIFAIYKAHSTGYSVKTIFNIILNFILIALGILLFVFPIHIEFLATISFTYCIYLFIVEPENILCIPLYFLGTSIYVLKGFFKNKTKLKIMFSSIIFLLLISIEFFINKNAFIESFIEKITLCLVLIIPIFFLFKYFQQRMYNTSNQILNIAEYQNLTSRDAEILILLQKKSSYKEIATELLLSPGTIRNRISYIFKQISIADKKEFMNLFSNAKIVFN